MLIAFVAVAMLVRPKKLRGAPAFKPALPGNRAYATYAALRKFKKPSGESCGSSVVEHSLGKGEAESSILSRSTIYFKYLEEWWRRRS